MAPRNVPPPHTHRRTDCADRADRQLHEARPAGERQPCGIAEAGERISRPHVPIPQSGTPGLRHDRSLAGSPHTRHRQGQTQRQRRLRRWHHPRPGPASPRGFESRARRLRPSRRCRSCGSIKRRNAGPGERLRPPEAARRQARFPRSAHPRAQLDSRRSLRARLSAETLHAPVCRRVSRHRSAAGGNAHATRRR